MVDACQECAGGGVVQGLSVLLKVALGLGPCPSGDPGGEQVEPLGQVGDFGQYRVHSAAADVCGEVSGIRGAWWPGRGQR